eukprot:8407728-Alexandrium_andersonii.AAC.1
MECSPFGQDRQWRRARRHSSRDSSREEGRMPHHDRGGVAQRSCWHQRLDFMSIATYVAIEVDAGEPHRRVAAPGWRRRRPACAGAERSKKRTGQPKGATGT